MNENEMQSPVHVETCADGAMWRVVLNAPKGNILDMAMLGRLLAVVEEAASHPELRALCFEGAGANFSFGASVAEHVPGKVDEMLPRFHRLFRALLGSSLVLVAAVRGRCLGGGLELAAVCHRIYAAPDAKLGLPEITLGVFAPVGSLVLPIRVGLAPAADLCLTGRVVDAGEAKEMGLVDEIADDPGGAAEAWVTAHLTKLSGTSLRHAVQVLHLGSIPFLLARLDEAERHYLGELMATEDAREGIAAFMEKRSPQWRHR